MRPIIVCSTGLPGVTDASGWAFVLRDSVHYSSLLGDRSNS